MLQKLFKYIFWTGYLAVLFTSFISITGYPEKIKLGRDFLEIRFDYLIHVIVYLLICMYYLIGLRKGLSLFHSRPLLKFIIATLLLATITEFVQLWVPARTFNVFDWIANVSGLLIGLMVIKIGDTRLKVNQ